MVIVVPSLLFRSVHGRAEPGCSGHRRAMTPGLGNCEPVRDACQMQTADDFLPPVEPIGTVSLYLSRLERWKTLHIQRLFCDAVRNTSTLLFHSRQPTGGHRGCVPSSVSRYLALQPFFSVRASFRMTHWQMSAFFTSGRFRDFEASMRAHIINADSRADKVETRSQGIDESVSYRG